MRTIAIGLDAFEWWYAEQLLEEGKLPHLAALRARGTSCRLANHVPYRSELSWTRYLTGSEPLRGGGWPTCVTFDPQRYEARLRAASSARPFYADLPGPVLALDLIHSSLAPGVDGAQVTAWGAHSPQYPRASDPPGLLRAIDELFGPSPAAGNDATFGWYDREYVANLGRALVDATSTRAEVARWLMERQPDWQLLLTCVSEIHGGGHQLWHGVDPTHPAHGTRTSELAGEVMEQVCIASDRAIGTILDGVEDDANVVVFALHGMVPADDVAATVLLPDLLHRRSTGRSLLRAMPDVDAWRRAGCPPLAPADGQHWGRWMRAHFGDGPLGVARAALTRRLPPAAVDGVLRLLGRPTAPIGELGHVPEPEQLVDDDTVAAFEGEVRFQVAAWYGRHWPTMRAFALPSFADGHVRVNLIGREAKGIVAVEDYEREVTSIMELLQACTNVRTGAPAVDDLLWLRRDDPFDPEAPASDLLVVWRDGPDAIEHPDLGVVGPIPSLRTGYHSPNGFAVMAGPDIPMGDLGIRPVDDLTATVVALAGGDPRTVIGDPLLVAIG